MSKSYETFFKEENQVKKSKKDSEIEPSVFLSFSIAVRWSSYGVY